MITLLFVAMMLHADCTYEPKGVSQCCCCHKRSRRVVQDAHPVLRMFVRRDTVAYVPSDFV